MSSSMEWLWFITDSSGQRLEGVGTYKTRKEARAAAQEYFKLSWAELHKRGYRSQKSLFSHFVFSPKVSPNFQSGSGIIHGTTE